MDLLVWLMGRLLLIRLRKYSSSIEVPDIDVMIAKFINDYWEVS